MEYVNLKDCKEYATKLALNYGSIFLGPTL